MTTRNRTNQRGHLPLRVLLPAAFLVLTLVPAMIFTIISVATGMQRERTRVEAQLATLGDLYEQAIEFEITRTEDLLTGLVAGADTSTDMELLLTGIEAGPQSNEFVQARDRFSGTLNGLLEGRTEFGYIMLSDLDGSVRGASDQPLINRSVQIEAWFTAAINENEPGEIYLTGPSYDTYLASNSLYLTTPVYADDGTLIGVLTASVTLDLLENVLTSLPRLGATTEAYLVRPGRLYVVPPPSAPDTPLATGEVIDTALSREEGVASWIDYRGEQVTGAYRWIDSLNMALVIKQDDNESLAPLQALVQLDIGVGLGIGLLMLALGILMSRAVIIPLIRLRDLALALSTAQPETPPIRTRFVEFLQLEDSLNRLNQRLRNVLVTQDQEIEARTRELRITAEMGRIIAAETDLNLLLPLTVNMLRDRLGYYHAQVFLVDDLKQFAVLKSSTGDAGQQLLSRNHKLPVGSRSVIGQVTERAEPVLASDTRHADYWLPNPLLPKTRAEAAVPLRVGNEIIGAIDVQSIEPDAFDEPTIATLQTIADQLAVAIRNAQLFDEKEGLLSASLELTQMLTRDSWETYLEQRNEQDAPGFIYDLSNVAPVTDGSGSKMRGERLNLPIELRGQVIGELAAELPEGENLSPEQENVVNQVLDRVALALENARLFDQTQIALMETNRLFEASQMIAEAETIETLLNRTIETIRTETTDHIAVYLVDANLANRSDDEAWITRNAMWMREPNDRLSQLPDNMLTNRPPLMGIQHTSRNGDVIESLTDNKTLPDPTRESLLGMGINSLATYPLIVGRRTIGWIRMYSRQEGFLNRTEARFIETVADQVATAVEGLRLLQQTEERARRLQYTNEVSRAASSILNPDILLPLVVDQISQAFGYYHVQVFIVDEMGRWAELKASTGEIGQELLRRMHRLEVSSQSVIGQVTSRGAPVIARDTDTDVVHRRNELLPNTRAEMAIPLKTGDRVIGALDVQSTEPNAFDTEAQAILQSLADQLSVTLENAQLFQEIQERVAELTTVNLVSQAVSRAETLEDLYNVVNTQMMRTFGTQYGYLGIYNAETNMVEVPIFIEGGHRINSPPPFSAEQGLTAHVIRTREVLVLNENVAEEAERLGAFQVGDNVKSVLIVPLLVGEEVIGVVSIQDRHNEQAYDESHIRQLSTLAAYIAVKLRNAELLLEAQIRASELEFLFDMTRAAVQTTDLDEALSNVVQIIQMEITGAESVVVYLADMVDLLMPHAAVGYGRDVLARNQLIAWGEGPIGQAAMRGDAMLIADAQSAPYHLNGDSRTRSMLLVPLASRGQVIGVVSVESSHEGRFDARQLRLLEAATGTLTAIVQNARLLEQINEAYSDLQELDNLKSQFLANMSHELRTPLNSIIGFSRVILKEIDGPLTDLQKQDLSTIYSSGTHLLQLINEVLDMSKIEAGKMEIQQEYIDVAAILDDVANTTDGLLAESEVELIRDYDAENLPQIWGDSVRVKQVLLNLASNAAKFTRQGSIIIRARYREMDPAVNLPVVQLDVQDSGIGIDARDMDKLFEAFRQVDGSTTRQVGGTGLGLPIAREFVEMHGGQMWVESEVGSGSVFSFTIPTVPPPAESELNIDDLREEASTAEIKRDQLPPDVQAAIAKATREAAQQPDSTGNGPPNKATVLAVDDEQGVLDLYVRFLGKEGYEVIGLPDADHLLHNIEYYKPDVLIMDINLPNKNGWEAIEELNQYDETRNLPVIICSIEDNQPRGQALGVSEYLVKPIIEEDLLHSLKHVIRLQHGPVQIKSILIVDPERTYGEAIAGYLSDYEVRIVRHGYEALGDIQENHPDLVFMDIELPDMDGFGLLVAMRSHEVSSDLPVIILTSHPREEVQLNRVDGGEVLFIHKSEVVQEGFEDRLNDLIAQISKHG